MFVTNLIVAAQNRLARRRRFNRLAAEIEGLTPRELSDLHADRTQMMQDLRRAIYG
jgi:hypothetical protein